MGAVRLAEPSRHDGGREEVQTRCDAMTCKRLAAVSMTMDETIENDTVERENDNTKRIPRGCQYQDQKPSDKR